jgi:hypothetical protein
MTRMSHDPRTKAYVARRTAESKTPKEIIRCLKRYIAREVYKALCRLGPGDGGPGAAAVCGSHQLAYWRRFSS